MYERSLLLYVKALTPVHVGVGRGEATHVDLPVQRDEFGFPTIWASSLKGAVKADLSGEVKKLLGAEPHEETAPSHISLLDARLILVPVRTLRGVWTYGTTPHLLGYLKRYLEIHTSINKAAYPNELQQLWGIVPPDLGKAISTKDFEKPVLVNELELAEVESRPEMLCGLSRALPGEVGSAVKERGLIVIPDKDGRDQEVINRSLMVQYRVRLNRETKTVEAGPWSEEYVPMETIFVSIVLCRSFKQGESKVEANEVCERFKQAVDGKAIYVGGKETIGRGLVKLLTHVLGV